jgi:hypothetical protein
MWHGTLWRFWLVGLLLGGAAGASLAAAPPVPLITEFLADNRRTLPDDFGKYEDWVEIRNPGPSPLNLGGWHLTDDRQALTKWTIPTTNLPPGQYCVVFASGRNRTLPGQPLHTNFKLSEKGEYLALVKPDGRTRVSEFKPAFPPQMPDASYGLISPAATKRTEWVYFSPPTPGADDGGAATNLGPVVTGLETLPAVVHPGQDLSIIVRVLPTRNPVQSVTLHCRILFQPEQILPMLDDGRHGDGKARDGVYGARLPGTNLLAGQMVRYAVTATDAATNQTRWPPSLPGPGHPQYEGVVVENPALASSRLPVLQLFFEKPAAMDSDKTAYGSAALRGEFFDQVGIDLHGQTSRGFPKHSYDLKSPHGHKFSWSEDAPRVGSFNLLSTWADRTHLRNVLAHEIYRQAGSPAHYALPIRVELNGRFHAVMNLVENGDADFLRRLGLDPEGALYKMYNSAENADGGEKKTRKQEDKKDLRNLIAGVSQPDAGRRQAYLYDHLDLPAIISFLAGKILSADADCCHKNYYLYRDTRGTGEWQAFPWDVDLSLGRMFTSGYFDNTLYANQSILFGYGNTVFTPVYDTPTIRQMFLRRLRTLMDEQLQPPGTPPAQDHWRQRWLELRDQVAPDATLDLAKWGTWDPKENLTQAVDRAIQDFLPERRKFLFKTMSVTNGGEIPLPQSAEVQVRIHSCEAAGPATLPAQEWVALTNANAFAVDVSGWTLEGPVRFTLKPGTVIPAHGSVYISPDLLQFRSRPRRPTGGESRLVVGPSTGTLARAKTKLILRDPTPRLVDQVAFPIAIPPVSP